MGSIREKSNIAIAIMEKLPFLQGNKNISHFDGSNNIFADCIWDLYSHFTIIVSSRTIDITYIDWQTVFV